MASSRDLASAAVDLVGAARATLAVLLCTSATLGSGCGPDGVGAITSADGQRPGAIIGGTLAPGSTWGFDVAAEHAVVIIDHTAGDCSGTLIADRVVLTAFHCIIQNLKSWYLGNGDVEPILIPPDSFSVAVGSARSGELCRMEVEAVSGHPLAVPQTEGNIIDNDLAVLTLASSVLETCPLARTIPMADGHVGAVRVGDVVVVGGFGATDGSFTQLDARHWAEMDVTIADPQRTNLIAKDGGSGMPAPGDSGGGVFVASEAGPIIAGITSTVAQPYLSAMKVAEYRDYVMETAGSAWTSCPPVASTCLDDSALYCVDGQIRSFLCTGDTHCLADADGARCLDPSAPANDEDADGGCAQTLPRGTTVASAICWILVFRRRRR